jgi:aconitate hydratase
MGILPLQFEPGESAESLGLTGEEIFHIEGLAALLDSKFANGKTILVRAENQLGVTHQFPVTVRIDTPQEILYYQHGGILQYVLRQLAAQA